MGNLLSREELLKKDKLEIVKVEFEDENYVFVRQMTGHERDRFEQSMLRKNRDDKGNILSVEAVMEDFRAKLAVMTLCDESGKLLLEPKDAITLSRNISAKKLETIINVAQRLNAITEVDKEGIVKNSVAVQDGSFSSDSVEN